MRILSLTLLFTALVFGSACGNKGKVLGKAPKEPLSTVLAIHAGDAPANLSLEGTMIEKCPQAGCWFRLKDDTGVIKVDTKAAGFVVTEVPLNSKVKIAGKVANAGGEPQVLATGLVY
jgi:uncharacterized protein YdeI (BOF family)